MKKKIFSILTLLCIVTALLPTNIITVSAYTGTQYGDYLYYSESNGEITITDCDTSVTEITIPSEIDGKPVTAIGYSAFYYCSSLTSVTIPDSVTSIGNNAFSECTGLTSITIPDSVTSIGNNAFNSCSSLTKVNITDIDAWCNINFVGWSDYCSSNPLVYAKKLYLNNKVVTNAVISDAVSKINEYAFYNCISLRSVSLPDSVTSIGSYAFNRCSSLTSITIPNSVTTIGDYTFRHCYGLTSVTIPDSVTSIGDNAFYNCTGLTSITIGDGVTSIGDYAFYFCRSLTKVNITDIDAWCNINFSNNESNPLYYSGKLYLNDNLMTDLVIPDSVTSIGGSAFYDCTGLTSVTIPDSVTSIGNWAFSNCSGLTNVTIPDSVTSIGGSTFSGCTGLTSVTIPDSVTSIGDYAFYNCRSLTSVTIPDSMTSIGDYAFYDCTGLTSVVIPNTVTEINQYAFDGCDNLATVFFAGSEEEWADMYIASGNDVLNSAKIVCNAARKTYKFETNCGTKIADITDYAIAEMPMIENGDKTLLGWYDNKNLTGSPVTFPYYGAATTLYAAWTDKTGLSFDDAFTAKTNMKYTVTIAESGQLVYYEFVPRLTGEYRFYSTGSCDTYGYLYNSSKRQLTSNDDGGNGNNFKITYDLTAGETYYIAVKLYSGTGSFELVTETDCVESTKTVCVTANSGEKIFISIPSYLPENAAIILACYNGNKLTDTQYAPNKNETIYFVTTADFDSAKVMVWESMSNIAPICEAEIVK